MWIFHQVEYNFRKWCQNLNHVKYYTQLNKRDTVKQINNRPTTGGWFGRSKCIIFPRALWFFLPIFRPMVEHHIWITHLISLLTSCPKYHFDVLIHFVDLEITNELATGNQTNVGTYGFLALYHITLQVYRNVSIITNPIKCNLI